MNIIFWLVALFLIGLMVFGPYDNLNGGPTLSRVSNILYQSSSRVIWAIGLGYIIYACVTSNGGLFNTLFSLPVWTPLARLSFSTYLIHLTLMNVYFLSQDHSFYFRESSIVFDSKYFYIIL
jgi:peptidoglycan/LPS O-acetylase OafA/YrhL